jgi:hypothetical protein
MLVLLGLEGPSKRGEVLRTAPFSLPFATIAFDRFERASNMEEGAHNARASTLQIALRRGLKPARTSSEKSSGCSQAAKCPPLPTLL